MPNKIKIIIVTPLYPPEIAEPAPYVKELAKRLTKKHQVNIVFYGHLPEKVPGASFIRTDKRLPLPLRLLYFTIALWKTAINADIIYAENGASVELPAGIVALITRRPLIVHIGDPAANKKAKKNLLLKYIKHFAMIEAQEVINDMPLPRPEIIPFVPKPQAEFDKYKKSWNAHIRKIENIFAHVLH